MNFEITHHNIIGLVKPEVDIHTLGILTFNQLLQQCGFTTVIYDAKISKAISDPTKAHNQAMIKKWIYDNNISVLGFSYRLDESDAVSIFSNLMIFLRENKLLSDPGAQIKKICFAGLPSACDQIRNMYGESVTVFYGDETPIESVEIMNIDPSLVPDNLLIDHPYDLRLQNFGVQIINEKEYLGIKPVDRSDSNNFGTNEESVIDRIMHGINNNLPPLVRIHAGSYLSDREEAVSLFIKWSEQLAKGGLLDILSIGTSQLTQEAFGEDWGDTPNGGGVPINSLEEFKQIYRESRPMLVRTYAGSKKLPVLAKIYEETIHNAWHALSLWWFSQIDGRGSNTVLDNLEQSFETIKYIARIKKPYEPNLPHHFAFRGGDDITYVVSAVLAARVAKKLGIQDFILQIMLNTPKHTSFVNDLAKARATITLVRQLEDENFKVYLQPRVGLNYLSHKLDKAKVQLASVTALMDDIEPENYNSPDIIHVVSYSEGSHLATPRIMEESIQITRYALQTYRDLKTSGKIKNMNTHVDVQQRMDHLISGANVVLSAIDETIKNPYSPEGFYQIFKYGYLPVPQLIYHREEFLDATRWKTKIVYGCVDIYVDDQKLSPKDRMEFIKNEIILILKE